MLNLDLWKKNKKTITNLPSVELSVITVRGIYFDTMHVDGQHLITVFLQHINCGSQRVQSIFRL